MRRVPLRCLIAPVSLNLRSMPFSALQTVQVPAADLI
jgi:hypothetical protein